MMHEITQQLQKMLGTAYEITTGLKIPWTIMTPMIDNMGDNIVIYVTALPNHQWQLSDLGYCYDDMKIGLLNSHQDATLAKLMDFYNVNIVEDAIVSEPLSTAQLINPAIFYAYLQAITDGFDTSY